MKLIMRSVCAFEVGNELLFSRLAGGEHGEVRNFLKETGEPVHGKRRAVHPTSYLRATRTIKPVSALRV
jgi:hypothetical protein